MTKKEVFLYLLISKAFNSLLVFDRLQMSITLVEPLVNRFNGFAIHKEGCPRNVNTSSKVVYSQVNANSITGIDFYGFGFYFSDQLNLKESSIVSGVNTNLFEGFVFNTFWEINPDFPKLFLELSRHRYPKLAIFDSQSRCFCLIPTSCPPARDYQQEVTAFGQVLRKFNPLLVASFCDCTNQRISEMAGFNLPPVFLPGL